MPVKLSDLPFRIMASVRHPDGSWTHEVLWLRSDSGPMERDWIFATARQKQINGEDPITVRFPKPKEEIS